LEIELSDFEAENATLQGDQLWQVVKIVIRGVQNVIEVRFMCLFMSLGTILLQGSISRNLFNPMRHQVDHWKVEIGAQHFGIIHLVADMIPPDVHFALVLGRSPGFSICLLVYLSLLQQLCLWGIDFDLRRFAGLPGYENIFEGVNTMQGIIHVAQSSIIVRFISSTDIEFYQWLCALN